MRNLALRSAVTLLLLATLLAGCDKLGLSGKPQRSKELPTAQQLSEIRYMSQAPGPDGRRIFNHLEQAKSCHDLEIAMRWNRPPDVKAGPFDQKMVYLTTSVPADLPKDTEVFFAGVIEQGQSLPSGGSAWWLKLKDKSEVEAVETAGFEVKQEEAQQNGGIATILHPFTPGRLLCGHGVYQGNTGSSRQHQHEPLISVLFAMDRYR
ncbi:MAG: hypothetical protein ACREUL_18685 [Steroidobacteraceae bacterium]